MLKMRTRRSEQPPAARAGSQTGPLACCSRRARPVLKKHNFRRECSDDNGGRPDVAWSGPKVGATHPVDHLEAHSVQGERGSLQLAPAIVAFFRRDSRMKARWVGRNAQACDRNI